MKKLQAFGEGWREISQHGNFRHIFFYKFLQISPSYQLAYKKLIKKEKISKDVLPKDFNLVLSNFKKFGNVFDTNYIFWWHDTGHKIFEKTGNKNLAFSIDTSLSKDELISQFTELIDLIKSQHDLADNDKIKLLNNKITAHSLHLRHYLVESKAEFFLNKIKKEQNWTLALFCNLSNKFKDLSQEDLEQTPDSEDNKIYLNILASKTLKEAYWIAENAARGKFPSLDKIDTGLAFDYRFLNKFYVNFHKNLMSTMLDAERNGHDFMKFIDPINLVKMKKKKLN
jgi:hypothetical protein